MALHLGVTGGQGPESDRIYDVIIVGGGAAGLTAGLYASRAKMDALLLEKSVWGGQIAFTGLVENYPGFPDGAMGPDLAIWMYEQATKQGLQTLSTEVTGIELRGQIRVVQTIDGDFLAKAVVVASGGEHRKLGVPGEEEYAARGVSNCAVCDGAFFRGEIVAVIGGGDAAIDEGLYLTRLAKQVLVIHRRDQLRASPVLQERAFATPNMSFIWNSVVEEVLGDTNQVTGIRVRNVKTNEPSVLDVTGVFIYIGFDPAAAILGDLVEQDEHGYIRVTDLMATNVPGIFAAGDIRVNSLRQLVSAAGDGCVAGLSAYKYVTEEFKDGEEGAAVAATRSASSAAQ
ncbi:MAG TPA: thioredoxin-disulfide reductase [Dehalococcoidia bacterium]|nr:thioredoxin-disulfide reductase [Dehalococcoidia bacterium]